MLVVGTTDTINAWILHANHGWTPAGRVLLDTAVDECLGMIVLGRQGVPIHADIVNHGFAYDTRWKAVSKRLNDPTLEPTLYDIRNALRYSQSDFVPDMREIINKANDHTLDQQNQTIIPVELKAGTDVPDKVHVVFNTSAGTNKIDGNTCFHFIIKMYVDKKDTVRTALMSMVAGELRQPNEYLDEYQRWAAKHPGRHSVSQKKINNYIDMLKRYNSAAVIAGVEHHDDRHPHMSECDIDVPVGEYVKDSDIQHASLVCHWDLPPMKVCITVQRGDATYEMCFLLFNTHKTMQECLVQWSAEATGHMVNVCHLVLFDPNPSVLICNSTRLENWRTMPAIEVFKFMSATPEAARYPSKLDTFYTHNEKDVSIFFETQFGAMSTDEFDEQMIHDKLEESTPVEPAYYLALGPDPEYM